MKKFSKKQKLIVMFFLTALILSVGLLLLWPRLTGQTVPHDIGSKMRYVGKQDFGCFPFPFSFLCVERPSSEYYFATTMTTEEVKTYFGSATYVDSPNDGGGASAYYTSKNLHFARKKDQKEFVVTYYDNTRAVAKLNNLKANDSELVLSLSDTDYKIATDPLGN